MGKSCFLFGHGDAPQSLLPILAEAIEHEVEEGTMDFFVGYHGNFDHLAAAALRQVKQRHRNITATLVLAYHPAEQHIEPPAGFDGTFYSPIENTPRRYAIVKANQYMVQSSDRIICYVKHYGNTRQLLNYAIQHKEQSIKNLACEK